ncbi:uncharacterized protein LOC135958361 [Calliphora vicina]|uniref:uncharacterized protein LOC135958361 n=1 Tax=Calliphora vicina TaxID=7373 RepID=UPI00325B5529
MFSSKCIYLVVACLILTGSSSPIGDLVEPRRKEFDDSYKSSLVRHVRSPGTIDLGIKNDQSGSEASVNVHHNLFTSSDGRFGIDGYARGSYNFDNDLSHFSGGIRFSF